MTILFEGTPARCGPFHGAHSQTITVPGKEKLRGNGTNGPAVGLQVAGTASLLVVNQV